MRFSKSIYSRRNMSNTQKKCGNYSVQWIWTTILHCSANSNNTIGLHCSKNSNKSCLNETLITYLTMRLNVPLGLFQYKQINFIPISARHSLRGRENEFETKTIIISTCEYTRNEQDTMNLYEWIILDRHLIDMRWQKYKCLFYDVKIFSWRIAI